MIMVDENFTLLNTFEDMGTNIKLFLLMHIWVN